MHVSVLASASARFWEFDTDGSKMTNFNYTALYRSTAESFIQNSFTFSKSCVIGHSNEIVEEGGKTVLINEFIAMFPAMFGTFVKCTYGGVGLEACKEKLRNGKIVVRMTESAKLFWEGSVWDEWEAAFPDLKEFFESYPRDKVEVELVQVYRMK